LDPPGHGQRASVRVSGWQLGPGEMLRHAQHVTYSAHLRTKTR
jgi:hypothetical protein